MDDGRGTEGLPDVGVYRPHVPVVHTEGQARHQGGVGPHLDHLVGIGEVLIVIDHEDVGGHVPVLRGGVKVHPGEHRHLVDGGLVQRKGEDGPAHGDVDGLAAGGPIARDAVTFQGISGDLAQWLSTVPGPRDYGGVAAHCRVGGCHPVPGVATLAYSLQDGRSCSWHPVVGIAHAPARASTRRPTAASGTPQGVLLYGGRVCPGLALLAPTTAIGLHGGTEADELVRGHIDGGVPARGHTTSDLASKAAVRTLAGPVLGTLSTATAAAAAAAATATGGGHVPSVTRGATLASVDEDP